MKIVCIPYQAALFCNILTQLQFDLIAIDGFIYEVGHCALSLKKKKNFTRKLTWFSLAILKEDRSMNADAPTDQSHTDFK